MAISELPPELINEILLYLVGEPELMKICYKASRRFRVLYDPEVKRHLRLINTTGSDREYICEKCWVPFKTPDMTYAIFHLRKPYCTACDHYLCHACSQRIYTNYNLVCYCYQGGPIGICEGCLCSPDYLDCHKLSCNLIFCRKCLQPDDLKRCSGCARQYCFVCKRSYPCPCGN